MTVNEYITCVICYDQEINDLDGMGWYVKFSKASETKRFGTLTEALSYISDSSLYFLPSMIGQASHE